MSIDDFIATAFNLRKLIRSPDRIHTSVCIKKLKEFAHFLH